MVNNILLIVFLWMETLRRFQDHFFKLYDFFLFYNNDSSNYSTYKTIKVVVSKSQ